MGDHHATPLSVQMIVSEEVRFDVQIETDPLWSDPIVALVKSSVHPTLFIAV